ncbi:Panacea domain-containing protein [Candidatus Phytoplasma pruni]|uniref:DUF4065 domain-containing protein n=1 Tax=Candidatus Phytoplasma pruni TaxID=479893 RepID=A0A851H9W6_9MOLU|nr:type II toxin-antitoxin system antitoxin SocA domain-containing protein [Candidatus Phytoplasma pruni]NWN45732.1 DUF4065 domain-containing protein [Candidatus Phytoplasma pruni]
MLKKTNVFQVANYIIEECHKKNINDLTNLKLQKLVYYARAHHLVLTKKQEKLVDYNFEAWDFGPVIPQLFQKIRQYVKPHKNITHTIPLTEKELTNEPLTPQQKTSIDHIIFKYGRKTGQVLSLLTHNESPWYDVWEPDKAYSESIITDEAIYQYYLKDPIL